MIRPLHATLVAIALAAVVAPALVVSYPPAMPPVTRKFAKVPRKHVVPAAQLPPVEPVRLVDLSLDEARQYNDAVPFVRGPNPAARPFRIAGTPEDRARATDCLAAAVLYEAGNDTEGQKAVAQVILNRLRHPAFPKTVCGVVFEGQDRSTGCQFTFTCDGAMTRWQPSGDGWKRAREVAARALSGGVYRPVGYATHYHTDWVVPYWQASLDKIASVHSHLFFRWTGWWGTPPAFDRRQAGPEPAIAKLTFSDTHRLATALDEADAALAEAAAVTAGQPVPTDDNWFLVTLPTTPLPHEWPAVAAQACGERPRCIYTGWRDARLTPVALPLSAEQIASMTFSYRRDAGAERSLWNCTQIPRAAKNQCMRAQVLLTGSPVPGPTPTPTANPTPVRGPVVLDGVRRRTEALAPPLVAPTPKPRGTPPAAAP